MVPFEKNGILFIIQYYKNKLLKLNVASRKQYTLNQIDPWCFVSGAMMITPSIYLARKYNQHCLWHMLISGYF